MERERLSPLGPRPGRASALGAGPWARWVSRGPRCRLRGAAGALPAVPELLGEREARPVLSASR